MKKIIFALFVTLQVSLIACSQNTTEKVGINESGKFIITSKLEKIKTEWSELLKSQKIETTLTDFEIISGEDKEFNGEIYYALIGRNKEKSTKVITLLSLIDNSFYFPDSKLALASTTVTCSGCSYACDPQKVGKRWICTSGCVNNCSKTVTVKE